MIPRIHLFISYLHVKNEYDPLSAPFEHSLISFNSEQDPSQVSPELCLYAIMLSLSATITKGAS